MSKISAGTADFIVRAKLEGRREERERLRKIIRREQRESPHLASSAFNEFCDDLVAALEAEDV